MTVETASANHPTNGASGTGSERWRLAARCRGMQTAIFFPAVEQGPGVDAAKSVCAECPVVADCLAAAVIGKEEYGIWGGTTPLERRREKRRERRSQRGQNPA